MLRLILIALLFTWGCSSVEGDDDAYTSHPSTPTPADVTPDNTQAPTSTPTPTPAPTVTPFHPGDGTRTLEVRNDGKLLVEGFVVVYGEVQASDDSKLELCVWVGTWLLGDSMSVSFTCDSDIDYPLPVGEWIPFTLNSAMSPQNYGVEFSDVYYTFCVVSENNPEDSTC